MRGCMLLHDHGTWELADVLAYAIGYARDGHPLLAAGQRTIARVAALFTEHWPTSADTVDAARARCPKRVTISATPRTPRSCGLARRRQATRSATTDRSGREARIEAARREWKTGAVARAAHRFLAAPHRHSDGADHAGSDHRRRLRGIRRRLRGRRDRSSSAVTRSRRRTPGRQGPALLQALRILDGLPTTSTRRPKRRPHGPRGAQARVRRPRRVLRRRPKCRWTCCCRTSTRPPPRADRATAARDATRRGSPAEPFRPPLRAAARRGRRRGEPTSASSDDPRRHVPHRRRRSLGQHDRRDTPRAGGCSPRRRSPNWASAWDATADDVAGSRVPPRLARAMRPRTTLTPTLVLRDGPRRDGPRHPRRRSAGAVAGAGAAAHDRRRLHRPAGDRRPSLHTTALVDSFWPRGWTPAGAVVEDRLGDDVIAGLERRGHDVTRSGDWSLGRVSAVGRDAAHRRCLGGGEPAGNAGLRRRALSTLSSDRSGRARRNAATRGASLAPISSARALAALHLERVPAALDPGDRRRPGTPRPPPRAASCGSMNGSFVPSTNSCGCAHRRQMRDARLRRVAGRMQRVAEVDQSRGPIAPSAAAIDAMRPP